MRKLRFELAVSKRHGVLAEKLCLKGLCLKERRELNKLRWYFDQLYPVYLGSFARYADDE